MPHLASQVALSAAAAEMARSHDDAKRRDRSRLATNDLIIFKLCSEFELSATNFLPGGAGGLKPGLG